MTEADAVKRIEVKLNEILRRLDRIEGLLEIEESAPYEDELEAIKEYLKDKAEGKLELIPLSEFLKKHKK